MPPKIDPYATPSARLIDLLLILLAIAVILLAVFTAPEQSPAKKSLRLHGASAGLASNGDRK